MFLEEIVKGLQFLLTFLLPDDLLCPGTAQHFGQRGRRMRFSGERGDDDAVHEDKVSELSGGLLFHGRSLL